MSLKMTTSNGKLMGFIDCEDETVIVNNKPVALSDLYQDDKLRQEFNDELLNSMIEESNDPE